MTLTRMIVCLVLLTSLFLRWPSSVLAQDPSYRTAEVLEILAEEKIVVEDRNFYVQTVRVRDTQTGETHTIESGSKFQPLNENQRLKVGSTVIVSLQQLTGPGSSQMVVNDIYRLPVLVGLGVLFLALVLLVSGKQGALSVGGMLLSLWILIQFIVPHILAGESPFWVTVIGASLTAVCTMYLSHGFTRQTHVALASMVLSLLAVASLSHMAVTLGQFVGLGSEDAAFLQFAPVQYINLQGLLLAGILLGALGMLDDITLAQTSVIEQLKAVNPQLSFGELYTRGLAVGKDHVASLVNTLVFAYAGTSLPLFLLFTIYRSQPGWVVINSEVVAEEVVRTLVGSIGLVLAVPITTFLASYVVSRPTLNQPHTRHRKTSPVARG